MLRRNELGRVMGSGFAFQDYDSDASYFDHKVKNVKFPKHSRKPSEVTTYKIGENGELIKVN